MDSNLEHEIRHLAYHIWQTTQDRFGQAVDFWVMAEQMVVELTAASAALAKDTLSSATEAAMAWPPTLRSLYLYRIHQLAHCMWENHAERHERSMDYWLAAEKHVRLLMETAARTAGPNQNTTELIAQAFEKFSPSDYLDQIQKTAHQLWEIGGRPYQSALDFWLAAENQILDLMASGKTDHPSVSAHQ